MSYEAGDEKKPGVLIVKIEGDGFPRQLNPWDPVKMKVAVTSSTGAFLTITNPNEAEVVTLTDPVTKIKVTTVVTRKPPPK